MALAAAVATSVDGQAQAQVSLRTPSVSIDGPGVSVDVPSVTVESPTPQVELPKVTPPPAPVAPAPPPVQPPPLPVRPPSPPVQPPSLPVQPPSLPRNPAPLPADRPSLPVDPPTAPGGSPSPSGSTPRRSGGSGPATAAQPAAGPQAAGAPSLPQSLVRGGVLHSGEWAKLAPAQRRELRRLVFRTPPPKQRVRQLRAAIRKHRDCLGVLPDRGRRALELRAGLLGQEPASRRTIARRIGTSPAAVLRLERSSLRRLTGARERGLCGAAGALTAGLGGPGTGSWDPGGTPSGEGGGSDSPSANESGADDPRPASEVLADVAEGGPGIDLGDGREGAAESLLFFLLALFALLVPLAAAAVALQRRAGGAAAGEADGRPLLFLDVDGVVALDIFSKGLPPGEMRESPLGFIYLPDRAGDLVRQLATRFDIVWATGWEHRANTALLTPLGLREELPTLTFGKKARFGSSEWKLKRVNAYACNRPAAWLDDNLAEPHARWAATRSEPTLLIPVDPHTGITRDHADRLLRWADRLPAAQEAAPANGHHRVRTRTRTR